VIGAFIPVAINTGARAGFAVLLAVATFATASYVVGRMAWAHRTGTRQTAATAAAAGIEDRFAEVSGEVRGRLAAGPRRMMHRIRRSDGDGEVDDELTTEVGPTVPRRSAHEAPDDDPASLSRVAWHPDAPTRPAGGPPSQQAPPPPLPAPPSPRQPPTTPYPWEPGPEPPAPGADYLDDLDPTVHDPYPWADGPPQR
jgi:hypothetical protein